LLHWTVGDRVLHLDQGTTRGPTVTLPREGSAKEYLVEIPVTHQGLPLLETSVVRFKIVDADSGRPVSDLRLEIDATNGVARIRPQADGTCAAPVERMNFRAQVEKAEVVESSAGRVAPISRSVPESNVVVHLDPRVLSADDVVVIKVKRRP
jgi:hypothetical protein